jgi:hypothetical protein
LFVQYAAAPSGGSKDTNVVVRYNISRNDQGDIFALTGDAGAISSQFIYNNTVCTPSNLSSVLIDDRSNGHSSSFYNNIFYNLSPTASYNLTTNNTNYFDCNVFYDQHPASEPSDAHKLTSDPRLVAPGTGTNGLDSLPGYELQSGSPCIDTGLPITTNLIGNPNAGGRDFWGNTVPLNAGTDRGANEWSMAVLPPTLTGPAMLSQGKFQFRFSNSAGAQFSVLATTNIASPVTNWAVIGNVTGIGPGQIQFSDTNATNFGQRFYRVRSP